MLALTVLAALLVGFLSGLLSFKIKQRWCPMCGYTTVPRIPGSGSYDQA
jgi:hypothetical protein